MALKRPAWKEPVYTSCLAPAWLDRKEPVPQTHGRSEWMVIKGVSYDVGRVMAVNWRPEFDPGVVRRELEIIRNDLHSNAVRICGLEIKRLVKPAETALELGLEVWLSPEVWDKGQTETLAYITNAAEAAERLRAKYPERLVLLVGSELTLFMQGIVPGRNITRRMRNPSFRENAGRNFKERSAMPR
ncbi:MAG: hypothetical protein ABSA01_14730 [Anaerolineales bacterium]